MKLRQTSISSVWDAPALQQAFSAAEVKDMQIYRVYQCVWLLWLLLSALAVAATVAAAVSRACASALMAFGACVVCIYSTPITATTCACTTTTTAAPPPNQRSALLRDPDVAYADIPNLPKAAVAILEQQFSRSTSKVCVCVYASTVCSSHTTSCRWLMGAPCCRGYLDLSPPSPSLWSGRRCSRCSKQPVQTQQSCS